MKKLKIRSLTRDDISCAVKVEQAAWPLPWPQEYVFREEHLLSQIETFQEGLLGAFLDGDLVGFVTTEIINSSFAESVTTWDQMTDYGFIHKTHNPEGDTMYGVNLSVHPVCARRGVAEQLLYAGARLAIRKSLKRIILGGRLPRYFRYHERLTPEEYIAASSPKTGKPLDPELYVYLKAGLKVVKVLPNYIPDPESMNYGILLEWKNPFRYVTRLYKPFGFVLSRIAQF